MSREWKPGDVAVVEIRDRMDGDDATPSVYSPAFYSDFHKGWISATKGGLTDSEDRWEITRRPLVVIDPEDREQVERLTRFYAEFDGEIPYGCPDHDAAEVVAMQAALRSLIEPPKPEEPTGLGALVEADFSTSDGKGFGPAHWSKAGDGSWVCLTDGHARTGTAWPFLTNVRVLSEGVTP